MFAAVGAMYAGTSCLSKSIRGTDDFLEAGMASADGDGVEGEKAGVRWALVAFAIASASVDATGEKIRGDGLFDDNATPGRVYFRTTIRSNATNLPLLGDLSLLSPKRV